MASASHPASAARLVATSTARFVLVALLVLLLLGGVLLAAACSGQTESLVGAWTSAEQGETLDFRSDGTLFFTKVSGDTEVLKWQADSKNVAIGVEGGGSRTIRYSIDGKILTLTYPNEEPARYERIGTGVPESTP